MNTGEKLSELHTSVDSKSMHAYLYTVSITSYEEVVTLRLQYSYFSR